MIIADTGFFVALLSSNDADHERAKTGCREHREQLITTWPVINETAHLLLRRAGAFISLRFVNQVTSGACEVFEIPKLKHRRLAELMSKYRDLPMDVADASLVILAEHLGHGRIFSTDRRDFRSYKWKDRKPFVNLLYQEP